MELCLKINSTFYGFKVDEVTSTESTRTRSLSTKEKTLAVGSSSSILNDSSTTSGFLTSSRSVSTSGNFSSYPDLISFPSPDESHDLIGKLLSNVVFNINRNINLPSRLNMFDRLSVQILDEWIPLYIWLGVGIGSIFLIFVLVLAIIVVKKKKSSKQATNPYEGE